MAGKKSVVQLVREEVGIAKTFKEEGFNSIKFTKIEENEHFYEVCLDKYIWKVEVYAYAYVQSENTSMSIFLYIPPMLGREELYSAFFLYEDMLFKLHEKQTLELAKKLFKTILN